MAKKSKALSKAEAKKQQQKTIKFTALIAGAVVIVLAIAAIISFAVTSSKANTDRGNTVGNIANHGLVVEDGEGGYIYANYGIINNDGKEIDASHVMYLNNYDGWIYAAETSMDGGVIRMRADGSERSKIIDQRAEFLNVVDDKLFFAYDYIYATDDKALTGIYSADLDGSNMQLITRDSSYRLAAYAGRLYFINKNDDYKLYSMKYDGSDRAIVTSQFVRNFTIYKNKIYCATENGICVVGPDGAGEHFVLAKATTNIFVHDDSIYFCNVSMSDQTATTPLYRMDLDGDNMEEVYPAPAAALFTAGDTLFMTTYLDSNDFFIYSPDAENKVVEVLEKGSLYSPPSDTPSTVPEDNKELDEILGDLEDAGATVVE